MRPGRGGVALVAALLVLAVVAALLAARATVQAHHIAAVDAQRRELVATAAADTALAWAWARLRADGVPTGPGETRWTLPTPLEGTVAVEPATDTVRLRVRAFAHGTVVTREVLLRLP